MPQMSTNNKSKLQVFLPEETKRRLKIRAASENKFLHEIVEELLENALKEERLELAEVVR
jgi:plasmid stability protein